MGVGISQREITARFVETMELLIVHPKPSSHQFASRHHSTL